MKYFNKTNTALNTFAVRWANFMLRFRLLAIAASVLAVVGLASQAKMEFNSDYHAFFSESNPELEAFDALQEKYTRDESVVIVLSPKDENIFTKENLTAIEELTAEAWKMPYSTRVDALTNYQHSRAEGDDLFVENLSNNSAQKSDSEIAAIREIALNEPLLVNRIVNDKGSVTAINVTIQMPYEDPAVEIPTISNYMDEMLADFSEKYPDIEVRESGLVPLNIAFMESTQNDLSLIGIMFILVIITTFVLTRSISGTISTLIVVLFSIAATVGFVGIMGIKLTPPTSVFPTMILTLAVADSIHILVTILQKMRKEGFSKQEAIVESIRINFAPVFVTTLTTVIGFLSMNFGDVPPFWDLGNITAFGMTMAFIFSTITLPALISVLPLRVKPQPKTNNKTDIFAKAGQWVADRPLPLAVGSMAVVILMGFFASKNVFNDDFIQYFAEDVEFRQNTDYISENLTGILNIEFSLNSGEEGGISNPDYLRNVSNFEQWLNKQPEVIHVNAFTDVTRRMNKSMHGDDPAYLKVPDNREEAAQYLLLYELSLPLGLDLNNQINVNKSESRMTVTVENLKSMELIAFTEKAQNWLKTNTPESMHALGVSPTLMFSRVGLRQAESMFNGNIVALLLISFVLIIALRNLKLGLLSIIPNVAPVFIGFGFWYFYLGEINVGMVAVFGMTLGIIVDDTVHFLSKFLRARQQYGMDEKAAVVYAFETVGRALFTTTVVLLAGFAVLSTSSFALNSYMARITSVIILAALIIDLLLLPALLILLANKKADTAVVEIDNTISTT